MEKRGWGKVGGWKTPIAFPKFSCPYENDCVFLYMAGISKWWRWSQPGLFGAEKLV